MLSLYETDLPVIAANALLREEENDHFLLSLKGKNGMELDERVHALNEKVSAGIDCTQCGNCCSTLIINVTQDEVGELADYLHLPLQLTKDKYIEQSLSGNCYINSVPCSFLADKKCTIYTGRFTECKDFPHLHKPGFRERFLGTLLHYGRCPIIYNVVELLKQELHFVA